MTQNQNNHLDLSGNEKTSLLSAVLFFHSKTVTNKHFENVFYRRNPFDC